MINKYQQGGQLSDTQQQGLQYLAQMYAQQTGKDPQQDQEGFMQFVQQLAQQAGIQDIGQLLDMVYQQAQGQAQAARRGAKLNYLKRLMNVCPEGEELVYFKAGGKVGCGCKKKVDKDCGGSKLSSKKLMALLGEKLPEKLKTPSLKLPPQQKPLKRKAITLPYDLKKDKPQIKTLPNSRIYTEHIRTNTLRLSKGGKN